MFVLYFLVFIWVVLCNMWIGVLMVFFESFGRMDMKIKIW